MAMVRSTTRQYTSAQRTCQPSRSLTSVETTHTSNTYLPYPSPIRPRTGCQRTPPLPTGRGIPLPQPHPTSRPRAQRRRQPGIHPGAPGETANPPLPLSTAPSKRPSPPPENDASSSSGSNYHSSPGSPDGSPANTSTSPKNTPVARATRPPRRTGNTSKNAPCIQAGTR